MCVCLCVGAYQPARPQGDSTRDDTCRPGARRPQDPPDWEALGPKFQYDLGRVDGLERVIAARMDAPVHMHTCVRACVLVCVGTKFR